MRPTKFYQMITALIKKETAVNTTVAFEVKPMCFCLTSASQTPCGFVSNNNNTGEISDDNSGSERAGVISHCHRKAQENLHQVEMQESINYR